MKKSSNPKRRLVALERRLGQANLSKLLQISARSIRRYKSGTQKMSKTGRERLDVVSKLYMTVKPTGSHKLQTKRFKKFEVIAKPDVRYFISKKQKEPHLKLPLSIPLEFSELAEYCQLAQKLKLDAAYVTVKGFKKDGTAIEKNTRYGDTSEPEFLASDIEIVIDFYEIDIVEGLTFHTVGWL